MPYRTGGKGKSNRRKKPVRYLKNPTVISGHEEYRTGRTE